MDEISRKYVGFCKVLSARELSRSVGRSEVFHRP